MYLIFTCCQLHSYHNWRSPNRPLSFFLGTYHYAVKLLNFLRFLCCVNLRVLTRYPVRNSQCLLEPSSFSMSYTNGRATRVTRQVYISFQASLLAKIPVPGDFHDGDQQMLIQCQHRSLNMYFELRYPMTTLYK